LDQLRVRGKEVPLAPEGIATGVRVEGRWRTSQDGAASPRVLISGDAVEVSGIRYGGVEETWTFRALADRITWRIDRTYLAAAQVEDDATPSWGFAGPDAWTGALLGTGGVAWFRFFGQNGATYGIHTGSATFWNPGTDACLEVSPSGRPKGALPKEGGPETALRFTRSEAGALEAAWSVAPGERAVSTPHYRFLRDGRPLWAPYPVAAGQRVSIEYVLRGRSYKAFRSPGTLPGIDAGAVKEILHTIGRLGVVDQKLVGSNGWYSGYVVLHEPWFAQMGLALDDSGYSQNLADTLDYQREHALGTDGRVKSRWAYFSGDAIPGTYDSEGFYEAQWGLLMDSQTSWPTNVAELYDLTGDRNWLLRQKSACEATLDHLLRRDSDGDGLVEMPESSHKAARGSDWIDVVWASHENALVNAQLYQALTLWAGLEGHLGDPDRAARYRDLAARLKRAFNREVSQGGFWDAATQRYVYWREPDGSIHGDNLVIPVNFSAIGYGICDDPARRKAVLDQIERRMLGERLFFWPLCFDSYRREEVEGVNWPFPSYENGDLFLAWGELGIRCYASYDPEVALRVVKGVLAQYRKDGLAFQRYLRRTQAGAGDDILANNCSPVVGLYRDLYGVRPRYNRLYLEPHLPSELRGTRLSYDLRGLKYDLRLREGDYSITSQGMTFRSDRPCGVDVDGLAARYFAGDSPSPALEIHRPKSGARLMLRVASWPDSTTGERQWRLSSQGRAQVVTVTVHGLAPRETYRLYSGLRDLGAVSADDQGEATLTLTLRADTEESFRLLGS
jgi:hypothetical protein